MPSVIPGHRLSHDPGAISTVVPRSRLRTEPGRLPAAGDPSPVYPSPRIRRRYPPYGYPATRQTNTFAIVALVLSFVFWPAGIVFGHIARRQIARSGESGRGLATAALVIGYLHFAFIALLIFVGVASSG